MAIQNLRDLFLHVLKEMLYAERKIFRALTEMQRNASHPELKAALSLHLAETEDHLLRLERVFEHLGKPARGARCDAIAGLVEEASDMMADINDASTTDAAIISLARTVEHYQIARYGTLVTWAAQLGHPKAALLLKGTLTEERCADNALPKIVAKPQDVAALA